jgi:NAD(P)-dependent dehydrogenase (short-subunit alcohol dehydrogenase family)
MKNILITGCSSGFGFDAAKSLADKGHQVFASMRNVDGKNANAAEQLRSYAAKNNVKIQVLEIDVLSDMSVQDAVSQIPSVDVLINNAGLGYGGPVEAFSSQLALEQLDLNIIGTLRTVKAVLPGMRKRKSGLIIQISSVAGRGAFPGFGIYNASKWGLEGVSEAMRYELAPLGIDVVIVEPGPFSTNFMGNLISPADENLAEDYKHIEEFSKRFGEMVFDLYNDDNAPTDPGIVVDIFDQLINTPAGERPLRTIAGLDFGFQGLNDASETYRKGGLEAMGIADWDGPSK